MYNILLTCKRGLRIVSFLNRLLLALSYFCFRVADSLKRFITLSYFCFRVADSLKRFITRIKKVFEKSCTLFLCDTETLSEKV